MSDPQLKDREAQIDENDGGEMPGGDEPALNIRTEGDKTIVESPGISKAEQRRLDWSKRVGGVVGEHTKPLQETIEHMKRTMEGMLRSMESRVAQPAPQQQQHDADEVDPDFMSARRRQAEVMTLISQAKTQQEVDRLERQYYKIDQDIADARAAKQLERFRRENPPQEDATYRQLRQEFPDVTGNPDAMAYAHGVFNQEMIKAKRSGKPVIEADIHRKALSQAAIDLGLRRPPAPAPRAHEQARFGGAPPSIAGGRGGVIGRPLSRQEQELARGMSPGASQEEADRIWAQAMVRRDPRFFG